MIRPFTCLCLLAAFGSGLYLYSEKHRTAMLDREIGRVVRDTQAARASTGLLRAEWALLNEPGRLQEMAGRYLTLKTMAPTQFVQLADLSSRLPAPLAMPAAGSTDEDEAEPQKTEPQAPPPVIAETPAAAVPPASGAKPQAKLLAHAEPRPKAPHHVALADSQSGLMQRGTPLPLAAPQPMGASVFSAMARPMRTASRPPVIVAAVPSYATAAPIVSSALGGRGSLPPPVPYGSPDR